MSLFFNSDIQKLYLGSSEVQKVYLGSTLVWSAGLPVGTTFDFEYTGSVQEITLPKGRYKLQCWGAQGGNVTGTYAVNGSKGGYSEGVLTLDKTTTLYIFVGGQGTSYTSSASQTSTSVVNGGWNGGGAGRRTSLYNSGSIDGRSFPRGGGGGTDIALVTSAMSYSSGRTTRDSASLLSRIIVAGGGAGASARYTVNTTSSTTERLYATNSSPYQKDPKFLASNNKAYCWWYFENSSDLAGKTIKVVTSGGDSSFWDVNLGVWKTNSSTPSDRTYKSYIALETFKAMPTDLGVGLQLALTATGTGGESTAGVFPDSISIYIQETTTSTTTSSGKSNTTMQGGGTSGKGQYPGTQTSAGSGGAFGLGANQATTGDRYCSGGGGGGWYGGGKSSSDSSTSYINYSGGGSGFVNIAANASSRPSGYTGLQLDSGTTKDGSTSFESTSGGTETGHSGNGYAKITVIE